MRSRTFAVVLLLAAGCRTVDTGLARAHLPCGLYRWPVKTLNDPDAGTIHWTPIDTTLAHLTKLPRPEERRRSHRTTYELYVYRVVAVVAAVHQQVDQDLHILLRDLDDPKVRMIAEVPSPLCANGAEAPEFAKVRKAALAIRRKKKPVRVEVTGVGFFDALRKHGSSYNGFELHPVVSLIEIAPEALPPQFAAEEGPTGGDDSTIEEEDADAVASEDADDAETPP